MPISDDERDLFQRTIDNISPQGYQSSDPITPEKQRAEGIEKPHYDNNADHIINKLNKNQWVGREEQLKYAKNGLNQRQQQRLKKGQIRPEITLDLHGLQPLAAQKKAHQCLRKAREFGMQCVLIIHGKGSLDPSSPPKLKNMLNQWLPSLPDVIGFHQSCPRDGGSGALYVLLSRSNRA